MTWFKLYLWRFLILCLSNFEHTYNHHPLSCFPSTKMDATFHAATKASRGLANTTSPMARPTTCRVVGSAPPDLATLNDCSVWGARCMAYPPTSLEDGDPGACILVHYMLVNLYTYAFLTWGDFTNALNCFWFLNRGKPLWILGHLYGRFKFNAIIEWVGSCVCTP